MKVYDNRPQPVRCQVMELSPGDCFEYQGAIFLRSKLDITHVSVMDTRNGEVVHLRPDTVVEPLSTARIVIGGSSEVVIGEPEDEG